MQETAEKIFSESSKLRPDEYSYYHITIDKSVTDGNGVTCDKLPALN